ncbi:MAG: hypothetical protein IIY21_25075 [Clostridiales bacterium]|nr:hypothetical protein [Clostridiales bacterium]MBQ1575040.1 hypothetical protein [Clostridiales bacterium]
MTALTIIYSVGALGLGFLIGMSIQAFIDSDQMRKLIKRNDRLKLENEALMNGHTEVIEIVDKRQPDEVDFSQTW